MGLLDHTAEVFEQRFRHAGDVQVQHALALVQQTHDHRLAVLNRHGGNPHIDAAALYADIEAAILGNPLLGNVQASHQFKA